MELPLKLIFRLPYVKSLLSDMKVHVDRERQVVTITQNKKVQEYTYAQLADLAEQLFPTEP
jgi:hypothetical protein